MKRFDPELSDILSVQVGSILGYVPAGLQFSFGEKYALIPLFGRIRTGCHHVTS